MIRSRQRDTNEKILDTALDASFESHDGFTRAFSRQFGIGVALLRLIAYQYSIGSRPAISCP